MKTIKPQKLGVLTRAFDKGDSCSFAVSGASPTTTSCGRGSLMMEALSENGRRKALPAIPAARAFALCGFAASCAGFGGGAPPRIVATDGNVSSKYSDAVRHSAAHDTPCPLAVERVVAATGEGDDSLTWVTEGCGARLTYTTPCDARTNEAGDIMLDCKALLIGRIDLTPSPTSQPAPSSSTRP